MTDAVRMSGISKAFGGIHALEHVSFSVRCGEIHALVGENGAGKSTLLKVLRGVEVPDRGTIELAGRRVEEYSPETARRSGVAMIFQEMSLVPSLSAAQNIFLNREPRGPLGLLNDRLAIERARTLFGEFGVHVDPTMKVEDMGAGQRQLTEIAKAVSERSRILILDEPTSALSEAEVGRLFTILQRLKADGVAIIYVSHRMDEIMRIADRVTVLRDGRHVVTAPLAELTLPRLIEYILGHQAPSLSRIPAPAGAAEGPPLLELRRVSSGTRLRDVSLRVRSGEVIGIAGLLGSGRSSLARVLYGLAPVTGGDVLRNSETLEISCPSDAVAAGIALVPEDRIRQGLIPQHSVADNICLPALGRISRYSWISRAQARLTVDLQIVRMRIKTESPDTPVEALSGGNQQKVALARWLVTDPDILILDEPTAGIDVGSKAEIVAGIRELARQGKAILLISSEASELLAASDRILVMANGRIVREILPSELYAGGVRHPLEAEHRFQVAIQNANAND